MPISKRAVLRSGFAVVIGLLLISTVLAYRVQESFSARSVEIHRRFVLEQEQLTSLRRLLWMAGITLRDHYINPTPDARTFGRKVDSLSSDGAALAAKIRASSSRPEAVDALEQHLNDLFSAVRTAAASNWTAEQRYDFLQQEIVPRRDAAGRLLREIEKANQSSLNDSNQELRDTRAGATQRLLIVLGICMVAGISTAVLAIRHSENLERQSAEQFRLMLEAKRELERLSARLMEVQEEERTRLSRELHDEIVQNLAVLKMEIGHAQAALSSGKGDSTAALARARGLAEETVHSVRNISLLLRPSLLDDLGLVPALQYQTEEFTRRTNVPCSFVENLPRDEFSDAVKTCVYRVTQEALRNCEKHSRATRVAVELKESDGSLVMEVNDDGIGFPPAARRAPSQLGVLGMRERAAALGGTLETGNRREGGAMVRLKLPITEVALTREALPETARA